MKKKIDLLDSVIKINYNPLYVSLEDGKVRNKTKKIRYIEIEWCNTKVKYFRLNSIKIMWKLVEDNKLYCGKYIVRETSGKYILQILENEIIDLSILFEYYNYPLLLSVVVPMYNVSEYIIDLLKSFPKTNDNYEVIFVDDCSTDDTIAKLRDNIDISNYKIISNEANVGLGETRNVGLENSKSGYVIFLDSDDWLNNGSIEYFLRLIIENKNIDMFIFNDQKCEKFFEKKVKVDEKKYYIGNNLSLLAYRHMSACVKLYKKEIFNEIKFKKNVTFEDVYLLVDIFNKKNIEIVNTNAQIYNYRQRNGSIINSKFTNNTINEYVNLLNYIFKKLDYEYAKFMYYRLCKHIKDRNGILPLEIEKISKKYNVKNCFLYELYINNNVDGKDKSDMIKLYYKIGKEMNDIVYKLEEK